MADQETFGFQAEVVQLLDLMINSLYSNKEIFLRELISNASDAIDRLRLELLSGGEDPEAEGPLRIQVGYDSEARTITVADNGIGMSRAEVIEHIGTIAKSGTREFFQALTGDRVVFCLANVLQMPLPPKARRRKTDKIDTARLLREYRNGSLPLAHQPPAQCDRNRTDNYRDCRLISCLTPNRDCR